MEFPKLKNKLVLAPMEGITNIPFRLLCKKYGASLAFTPQLSSLAVINENARTLKLSESLKEEKPIGVQLSGRDSKILLKAAKKLEKKFDVIDLNFGCPSKKIIKNGYGAALLKEKKVVFEIVKTLSSNLNKPVTVKIRAGFKKVEALELAKIIEKSGASAITIHARTQKQGYSGKADWSLIRKIKEKSNIVIIGNGDVIDEESCERILKETKCDYVMIGRAAMKNPFIFKRINYYLKTGKKLEQKNKFELFREYYRLCKKYNCMDITNLKQTLSNFTQGMENSCKLRDRINRVKSVKELLKLI